MSETLTQINQMVEKESAFVESVMTEVGKVVVGQIGVIERLLIAVLANGHVLLEGVPGLAKTLSILTLSQSFNLNFKRIQFTPDLFPADIVGTMIYNPATHEFVPKLGPVFTNFLLADEINRSPAKVQSALLEAMQEKQVTIGDKTYPISPPFMVMATQNPIEQEGTYPLPEAQVDRFLMKVCITYPSKEEERIIVDRMAGRDPIPEIRPVATPEAIQTARQAVQQVYIDDKLKDYILDIIFATRNPEAYNLEKLKPLIQNGASPRASISLINAAKAHAFIRRRGFVTPEDIKAIGKDVLRHRVMPTFEAEAENVTSDYLVDTIFSEIEVP